METKTVPRQMEMNAKICEPVLILFWWEFDESNWQTKYEIAAAAILFLLRLFLLITENFWQRIMDRLKIMAQTPSKIIFIV